ncbi:MAG: hypothetical protein KKE44_10730 [Proteobacteria bacterium]|nr:hypothetical protein [Pseudomonadota bacterium]MBU1583198.1 hypothetical protein [Pseudomonadota bacterium]
MIIKIINNILNSVILLWIILFGVISNHPECSFLISDICHDKKLSFTIKQVSILPCDILALNSMAQCRDGVCCEEQQCKDEKKILISGQYQKLFKQVLGNETIFIFPNDKTQKRPVDAFQNKIPQKNSIYIFTQTFLI